MKNFSNSTHWRTLKISITYFLFSAIWIVVSDNLTTQRTNEIQQIIKVQTLKGLGFVLISSILLYILVFSGYRRQEKINLEYYKKQVELDTILTNIPSGLLFVNDEGKILDVNPRIIELSGYSRDELEGKDTWKFSPTREKAITTHWLWEEFIYKDKATGEVDLKYKDGSVVPSSYIIVRDVLPATHLIILVDISKIKTAESKLQTQIKRIDTLRQLANGILVSEDLDQVLKLILSKTNQILNVQACNILLYDENQNYLRSKYSTGFKHSERVDLAIPFGVGFAGLVAKNKLPVEIIDLEMEKSNFWRKDLVEKEKFNYYYAMPILIKGEIVGVFELFDLEDLNKRGEWKYYFDVLVRQTGLAIAHIRLIEKLKSANQNIEEAYEKTLMGWAKALEYKDKETEGHSQRVTELTVSLARKFGITGKELKSIRWGALLHDIGKMSIPDDILFKQSSLSDEEWAVMKQHPEVGFRFLEGIDFLGEAIEIPLYHHERWNGSGYPYGLKGKEIPLAARIFAVVDVWDALNHDRPYRAAWPQEKIISYLLAKAGVEFDPDVVIMFLPLIEKTKLDHRW